MSGTVLQSNQIMYFNFIKFRRARKRAQIFYRALVNIIKVLTIKSEISRNNTALDGRTNFSVKNWLRLFVIESMIWKIV